MARMGDILRADELKLAKDAYDLHLRRSRAEKVAAYAAAVLVGGGKRVNRGLAPTFIKPFGAPDNFWYQTKRIAVPTAPPTEKEENANTLIGALVTATAGFRVDSLPAGNNLSNAAKKIQFAKARVTERGTVGTDTTSRLTGLPYKKYNSNTVSTPYGVGTGGSTEPAAKGVIRQALMVGTPTGRTVGFTSQGYVGDVINAAPAPA